MQITQTTGRVFDIRLQMMERAVETCVPFTRQPRQVPDEGISLAVNETRQPLEQRAINRRISGEEPLIEQADIQLDILVVEFGALRRRTDRMADSHATVP